MIIFNLQCSIFNSETLLRAGDGRGCYSPYNYIVNKRIIISKKMIRHEMLAFYKALYSVCLKPYASKLPTAFIQKESPSFVWCISCLISENNALMRHCTIVQMISTYTLNIELLQQGTHPLCAVKPLNEK